MYFAHFFVIFALFYLCNMDYFLIQFFEKPLPPQRKRPKYTRDGCYMSNRNWREKSMWSIKVLHCDLCVQLGHESLIHLRTRAWSRAQKQPWPAGWPMTPALQSGMTSTLLSMSKYLLSLSLSPCLISHLIFDQHLFLHFLSCVFITFSLIRLDLTVTCWAVVIHLIRENGWICKQSNNLDGDFN